MPKLKKDDKNVENTNSDSLLSKLSVVSQGYRVDPFLRELCSSPDLKSRRSPAINRGYLSRLLALEVSFERILLLKQVNQVLSLGAGFDSMFFRLLNSGIIDESIKYYEVDYPESVHRKHGRIRKSSLLASFFKKSVHMNDCYIYDDGLFNMIGCNMTHIEEFEFKLKQTGFDPNLPTVILTECSTTYITADDCVSLVTFLNRFIKKFVYISYEQIRPNDDFGQIMTDHFEKRNSALKCVKTYPTIEHHRSRFLKFGWDKVLIRTIENIWKYYMNESETTRLNKVEDFDEVPELMLKCLHYVLIIGIKGVELKLDPFWTSIEKDLLLKPLKVERIGSNESLKNYGQISWTINDKVYVLGGVSASQDRNRSISCLTKDANNILWTIEFKPLLFAACTVKRNVCYVYGGRESPSDPKGELFKIDESGQMQEIALENKPRPRWGHTLNNIDKLFIIGGRDKNDTFNEIIEIDGNKCTTVATLKYGLFSHSTVHYGSKLIINGGLQDFSKCQVNEDLIIFDIEKDALKYVQVQNNVARFAHTSHILNDSKLIQIGGVTTYKNDVLMTIMDLNNFTAMHYESDARLPAPLVQHCSRYEDGKVIVFGGGTNCFSFGMHVNPNVYSIEYKS